MSDFDLQGLVQVGISTDRSAHKRIVNDAVAELTRLQSKVERLAKFVRAGDRLCRELESWLATEHDEESQRAINIWKRLRQQADELGKSGGEH